MRSGPFLPANRNRRQSWRYTSYLTLTSTRTAPIHPGEAPNLRRRSLVGLDKDCIEATKAAETRAQRDLSHREVRFVEQALRTLDTGCFGYLQRGRVQVSGEQSRQMAGADP